MTRVEELEFAHPVVVFDGGTPHWHLVEALATQPLTTDGISAFIRYEDEVATRHGYLVSRWVTENQGQQYAGVLVYSVLPTDPGDAPGHPSDDPRFRETTEAHATTQVEAAQRLAGPANDPRGPALWAAAGPEGPLVPVSVTPSVGLAHVTPEAAGLLPQHTDLLLAAEDLPERLAGSPHPVAADVYGYTHRTREKVAARVAAGRARPAATLLIGTLEQFDAAGRHR